MKKNEIPGEYPIQNDTPLKEMDEDIMFRGALYFYSKGSERDVVLDFEFSHAFDENYDGPAPAAYKCLRDVGFSLSAAANRLGPLEELPEDASPEEVLIAYAEAQPDTGVRH